MPELRVALFVEGSASPAPPRGPAPLELIWNRHIADTLRVPPFEPIVPISKKHLVAMDPSRPKMSGAGEPLDMLMARTLERQPFDAAVVAWDLVPAWNPDGTFCRWEETLDLYRLLAASKTLPASWRSEAQGRHENLLGRQGKGHRPAPPGLSANMVVAVCMEPMFEALLVEDEQAVRRALGLEGAQSPKGWPSSGWGPVAAREPDKRVLLPAIRALKAARPRPEVTRQVVGDFRTNKDGWGEYLLRRLLSDRQARPSVLAHALYRRLGEWLA